MSGEQSLIMGGIFIAAYVVIGLIYKVTISIVLLIDKVIGGM